MDPRILINGYNPTPIEPLGNALMRREQFQQAQQANALNAFRLKAAQEDQTFQQQDRQSALAQSQQRNALLSTFKPGQPFDVARAVSLGMKPDEIRFLAEAHNLGRSKVARTVERAGPNGMPETVAMDEYGSVVGQGMPQAVKMQLERFGGHSQAINPYALSPGAKFNHSQTPDGIAADARARAQMAQSDRHHQTNASLKAQEIGAGGKPPPGYRWSATTPGALEAIPGGPGDKLPEKQQNQVVGTQNLSNAIKEYRDQLSGFEKWNALSPDARAAMGTKYQNMLLQAKEAYNLGVLNGPDFEILQSVITSPLGFKGAITSKKALDGQAAELDRIMGGVSTTSSNRRPQDGAPRVPQKTGPKPGVVEGGYRFKGGDPADSKNWEKV